MNGGTSSAGLAMQVRILDLMFSKLAGSLNPPSLTFFFMTSGLMVSDFSLAFFFESAVFSLTAMLSLRKTVPSSKHSANKRTSIMVDDFEARMTIDIPTPSPGSVGQSTVGKRETTARSSSGNNNDKRKS